MPVRIVVLKEDKPIDQILITQDVVTIGRRSDCDISIKDPAVSGNHAKIQRADNKFLIMDDGSTNGVHIDGQQIKQRVLKNGDIVVIGTHQLRVIIDGKERPPPRRPAARTAAPARPSSLGQLKVLSGEKSGSTISLVEGLTTIGEPGVQVAAVSKRPQGFFIIHVDGGKDRERVPLVNGEPTGFKSRKLEDGDNIEVAGVQMQYEGP
jgi:pSer/pThr/pTyr-binding forkhead associated (FHA) protein